MRNDPAQLFAEVAAAVDHDPSTGRERGFGSGGLKAGGKLFAMLVNDELVVKVPRDRARQLVAEGRGAAFDPGHGRVMREWVSIPVSDRDDWSALAHEAREYVAPARGS